LPLPYGAARRWLAGGTTKAVADVEGAAAEDEEDSPQRTALIWGGVENSRAGAEGLNPGDTVVVRSSEGGCDGSGNWDPDSDAFVRDIGDLCANARARQGGGRYRIRVHPQVVFPGEEDRQDKLRAAIRSFVDDDAPDEVEALVMSVPELAEVAMHVAWGRAKSYAAGGLLVASRTFEVNEKEKRSGLQELDETDEDDTGSLTTHKELTPHTKGVANRARTFTKGCGLDDRLETAIKTAAERHDWGKGDERFQRLLEPLWDSRDEFLAKNYDCSPREYLRRRRDSGYPNGARHEFASVALAEAWADWPEDCDSELVLHLIGTHHGYGRALPPAWTDRDFEVRARVGGREVAVRGAHRVGQLDSGWTDRYWAMTRRYGWWGLAYLEAILRRADCVQSREEQEERR
jgi:CRISPR-associated endonuclease/helicase Cas3